MSLGNISAVIVNSSETSGAIITNLALNTFGSVYLMILSLLLVVLVIGLAFRLPFNVIILFMLPIILVVGIAIPEGMIILAVSAVLLAVYIVLNWWFK